MTHQCRSSSSPRVRSQRGTTLVESALVYSAFLMLLIGTIDVGYILWVHQTLTERTRGAVRYGTSRDGVAGIDVQVKNIVLYGTPAPVADATPSFGLKPENVSVSRTPGVGENPDQITVAVSSYAYKFITPFVTGSHTSRTISVTLPMEAP